VIGAFSTAGLPRPRNRHQATASRSYVQRSCGLEKVHQVVTAESFDVVDRNEPVRLPRTAVLPVVVDPDLNDIPEVSGRLRPSGLGRSVEEGGPIGDHPMLIVRRKPNVDDSKVHAVELDPAEPRPGEVHTFEPPPRWLFVDRAAPDLQALDDAAEQNVREIDPAPGRVSELRAREVDVLEVGVALGPTDVHPSKVDPSPDRPPEVRMIRSPLTVPQVGAGERAVRHRNAPTAQVIQVGVLKLAPFHVEVEPPKPGQLGEAQVEIGPSATLPRAVRRCADGQHHGKLAPTRQLPIAGQTTQVDASVVHAEVTTFEPVSTRQAFERGLPQMSTVAVKPALLQRLPLGSPRLARSTTISNSV